MSEKDNKISTKEAGIAVLKKNVDVLSKQAENFVQSVAPYLQVNNTSIKNYVADNSSEIIQGMRFFRLKSCTTEEVEDLALYLNEKMEKLFVATSSLNEPIAYGIASDDGQTSLVIGVQSAEAESVIKSLIEGLLTGIEIADYTMDFKGRTSQAKTAGIISAVPILKVQEDKQRFDISTLMRSLNGHNYTVLCVAKPYPLEVVQAKYAEIVDVRDQCFAVSKRNLANQSSETDTTTKTKSTTGSVSVGVMAMGAIGPAMGGVNVSTSVSTSVSNALSKAIGTSETVSYDVQNGFALEMMEYCDKAIERLRQGQNLGMWGTAIAYSASTPFAAQIIRSCLCGELAKGSADILPLRQFDLQLNGTQEILIPKLEIENPLLAPVTSTELGLICTPPFESVPDFELKKGKIYPMIASSGGVVIGNVSDGHRPLEHMEFSLSEAELNKHTFVCGITGSGKTTTVKGILRNCNKPFMVIESAKKEYRNIDLPDGRKPLTVYTLGKPEIHCLQFNPFYIPCGINLQTHIDFLKDLFNASFSFYGPMPYILEKCLHNVYRNKGWNLTLGYHPQLVNRENIAKIFDYDYMKKQYALKAHKYLFPTMQELKDEVTRYIEEEMQYDGEVGGNIKTAILARLESLCVGSKGFMFNTNELINLDELMEENVVFELEGLADDSDKAFCVGLLVVFINEYRQVKKEKAESESGLQHLLVIEEAHRLLKNVDTEKSSENMGNPKGKAVEHFTNMIAEMRSYGQGVIIAEQIPSKLAPDVIKNSSNKIIQRVVSADDQVLVANTIGVKAEDAVYLGGLKTGFALCHKEGMSLPVFVKVNPIEDKNVSDKDAYLDREGEMFAEINYSLVRESTSSELDKLSLKMLNCLMAQSEDAVLKTLKYCKASLKRALTLKNVSLIYCREEDLLFGSLLAEGVINLLINGVYKLDHLVADDLHDALTVLFRDGLREGIAPVREMIRKGYMQDPKSRCLLTISELIKLRHDKSVNLLGSIRKYFYIEDAQLFSEIEALVKKGVS